MNLEPNDDQQLMADMFARFLSEASSMARVRAALASGFDRALWQGLAAQGALAMRVPESAGGLGLGIFDAGLLMEEAGRTLVSGPLAEALVALRLLASLDPADSCGLLQPALRGECVVSLALHDVSVQPQQVVGGGRIADVVILLDGESVVLLSPGEQASRKQPLLGSTASAWLRLDSGERRILGQGTVAVNTFLAAVEEWKLLIGMALIGLSRESLRLAARYACEREQFDRPIGSFQAISHPLASAVVDVDAGRLLLWRAIHSLADTDPSAGAHISQACWWACKTAEKAVAHALHTFGGYGLTLEYDIHLYNLRAKAWPLVYGDPEQLLNEAAQRLYQRVDVALPDPGPISVEFGLGDEADALAMETEAFFATHLSPQLRARAHYSWGGHDPEFHRKLGAAGLLFPAWPKRLGGRDASPYAVHAALEVWHRHHWTTHGQATCNMVGYIIDQFGSEQLKTEALGKVAAGEACCALGFTEPGSGSDVFAAKTRAIRDGDGWRIEGQKMFTSGAEWADYVLLLARTDADGPKHRGLTMFIVPIKTGGVSVQPVHTFQDERTNVTFYDGVWVADSYRLGDVGDGVSVMSASLKVEHGMTLVKEHEQLLRAAVRLCSRAGKRGGLMIDEAGVQRRLARVATHVALSELLNYRALWVRREGKPDLAFGPASKLFSSEVYLQDAFDLLNLTAPDSLVNSCEDAAFINQCFRHSQVGTIYGGTSEVHRSQVAERQLGLPRTR